MGPILPGVILWTEQGSGAFNSWNDILELGKRADGSFTLRLRRRGIDDPFTSTLYRSRPFRTADRLLDELPLPHLLNRGRARWNPPADEWLAGARAKRIESMGFAIGGEAENYHLKVQVESAADLAAIAKAVVRIFYLGFDYRGTRPIRARLVYEGRSKTKQTYSAFTPEDVAKVFGGLGYRVEERDGDAADESAAVLRCRKRGSTTLVELLDQVDDENVYRRVRFSADVELPEDERQRLKASPDAPEDAEPVLTVSIVRPFGGGVTLDWLIERIEEWGQVLRGHRRAARRKPKPPPREVRETIH